MHYNLLTILGPTATGKTRIAVNLAKDFNGEIISADSRQVYRGMDIGTGKDLHEYKEKNVNHHLIDICNPSEEYNLFRFKEDFTNAFELINKNSKLPILAGGTGLYLSSIIQDYSLPKIVDEKKRTKGLNNLTKDELVKILQKLKPKIHNITDLVDKDRIIKAILVEQSRKVVKDKHKIFSSLNIGIKPSPEIIKKRITARLKKRLNSGMIEEVRGLFEKGVDEQKMNFFGLEYKYSCLYITGKLNYNDMFQKLNSAINNFAKRQITWFKKMEREGVIINWFTGENYNDIFKFTQDNIRNFDASTRNN